MGKRIDTNWEAIKSAVCAGMSFVDAGNLFRVSFETVKKRAYREEWPTLRAIEVKAGEIRASMSQSQGNSGTEALSRFVPNSEIVAKLAENWVEKGENHRKLAYDIAHGALKRANIANIEAKDWSDVEKVDRMARRAAGLDSEDTNKVNISLNLVNQRIEAIDV